MITKSKRGISLNASQLDAFNSMRDEEKGLYLLIWSYGADVITEGLTVLTVAEDMKKNNEYVLKVVNQLVEKGLIQKELRKIGKSRITIITHINEIK